MSTSIHEVSLLLRERGVAFEQIDRDTLDIEIPTKVYLDADGRHQLFLLIQLTEEGRYFLLSAPSAYLISEDRAALFALACTIVQWKTKLIQFEYDAEDGEVRPVVEFPLEDSRLTGDQLLRCIHGMVDIVDEFDPALRRVISDGVIDFGADEQNGNQIIGRLLRGVPPDVLRSALEDEGKR